MSAALMIAIEGEDNGHIGDLTVPAAQVPRIALLNDAFRQSLMGGWLTLTQGVASMPEVELWQLIAEIQAPLEFVEGDDPHGEHDFGVLEHCGTVFFWKIDAFDLALRFASPDPTDPAVTTRVMTIMRADEY